MDHNNPEILKDPGGELGLTADWGNSESFCPEKEPKRCSSWTETEDLSINGYMSQSSISYSLQRAEVLFKNTFNPSLKWLFHGHSEDEEEENFVVAYNLVSRSSARLLRLQQTLLIMSPQWQLVGEAQMTSPQACVKGLPGEGGVLFLPSFCCLQGHYRALWMLLNQRSSLVFIHEYSRRARLAAAYVARVRHLLEHQLKNSYLTPNQVISSTSSDLLAQVVSETPTSEGPTDQLLPTTIPDMLNGKVDSRISCDPVINTTDPVNQNKDQNVEGPQQKWKMTTRPDTTESSGFQRNGDSEKEDFTGAEGTTVNSECVQWPHSVQWSDLGQSMVFADLLEQYHTLLWTLCSKALWLQMHVSHESSTAESINLQDNHMSVHILHRIGQASASGLVPKECKTMLEDVSLYLLIITAHSHWDYVVCRSLGSSLKDQCLANQGTNFVMPTSKQDGSVMNSLTMEHFLLLPPPLLSSLCCHHVNSGALGPLSLFPSRFTLRRQTVSLVLASVQLSTVWVMSKAYQFLSSWSLNKFLLITQGDLNMVRESLEMMVHQTKCLVMNSDSNHHSTFRNHNELLLGQQTEVLDRAVSELQTFSSLVLKTFSSDCKRMAGEIFERTMPSAVHWRPSNRADFPSSPSEYASLAAQTVIGQVLEGVAPLSDDARVQALSITMTAFMEAWMEHILKQKIKFSIHGALQLKQDFDSIRDMIQSDRYGLSSELHQRLLGLRVFQQVDSAVVCLLQQPQAKLYLQPRAWEPFKRCCPANSSRESIDASVSSSITNLRCMEGEDATHSEPSVVTTHLPPVDPSSPTEPYLAPSLVLGAAQQEWLDLRIQSSARRWRLPGLQCVSKSEP
ncbi:coiled-coil domain-containing protein 142 isoform X4 [Amphiprion ocellaris]|uniref:coiled-coil domain-containing protein 142 isoform X4 n=1 Tax=Amphiprion ocellaris TaxID=80972 RepID=UPI002411808D|nr:coiled-coil domain-containing protein 142 isoform X4 [Amphiprion ocellaris]